MGYVIYYQPKGGAVRNIMLTMYGNETEKYLLEGLQRGVTYNIPIVAVSHELPSPLVGPTTVIPGISGTTSYSYREHNIIALIWRAYSICLEIHIL